MSGCSASASAARYSGGMKLAILSRNSKLYSTQRLVAAARERGHTVRVLEIGRAHV